MELETFLNLPKQEVARIVREAGPKVCVFPINGTRRWFMLEHPHVNEQDFAKSYLEAMIQCYVRLYGLWFSYGADTVLAPAFGPDLMARGDEYTHMAATGWVEMVNHPVFVDFCDTHQVRVRFYGDYRKVFQDTAYAYLLDIFDALSARTEKNDQHRLFFGLFAHDPAETLAELAIEYYQEHQCIPDKRVLIELYYGEYVPPVNFFVGFDKFAAFDMPLVATGSEDLYFTVAPSPYLTERQLRTILYDHLYARPEPDTDYSDLTSEGWTLMWNFYRANQGQTLGIGKRQRISGFWYPLPQVNIPDSFA